MKSISKLLALTFGLAACFSLASCGSGNPEEEKKAVDKVAKDDTILREITSDEPLPSGEQFKEYPFELEANDGACLIMTTTQQTKINGTNYTVNIDWTYGGQLAEVYIKSFNATSDGTHKKMIFNYPTTSLEFHMIAKIKCGSQSKEQKYYAKLNPLTIDFEDMTIAQLLAPNVGGTNYHFTKADGTVDHNFDKQGNPQNYYYVAVPGKVMYKVPSDGNFMLIADGKQWLQVWHVESFDEIKVGDYVTVYGEIGCGYGNVQLSYVSKIDILEDHSSIKDPEEWGEISSGINDSSSKDFQKFFSNEVSNVIGEMTDVVYNGNIYLVSSGAKKNKVSDPSNISTSSRYSFEVKNEGKVFEIVLDYHINDAKGSQYTAIKNILKNAVAGTTHFNLRGSLRYSNGQDKYVSGDGWQLVLLETTDLSLA